MPDNDQQKIRFSIPVELIIRDVSVNKVLAKIENPSMSYTLTKSQLISLQEHTRQENIAFDKALFEEMKSSPKTSETLKPFLDELKWKYPEYKHITFDLQLAGKVTKDNDERMNRDIAVKYRLKPIQVHRFSKNVILLRSFYLLLLITFILAMIGIYYATFHK